MSVPLNSGWPPAPPKQYSVQFGIVDGRYLTTIKQTYDPDLNGVISSSRGFYSSPDPSITDGVDFSSIAPFVNPQGMQLSATSNPYTAEVGSTHGVETTDIEAVKAAQLQHWSQIEQRQLLNYSALLSVEPIVGAVQKVSGPHEFVGEIPPLPTSGTQENPVIGPTLTFTGVMPAAPEPTGGTKITVGYMLTGEGIVEETDVDGVITLKKTFTSAWKVELAEGYSDVTHVKTKDYTPRGPGPDPLMWSGNWTITNGADTLDAYLASIGYFPLGDGTYLWGSQNKWAWQVAHTPVVIGTNYISANYQMWITQYIVYSVARYKNYGADVQMVWQQLGCYQYNPVQVEVLGEFHTETRNTTRTEHRVSRGYAPPAVNGTYEVWSGTTGRFVLTKEQGTFGYSECIIKQKKYGDGT